MQSINAGFQSLKTLLPHTDGEKLSKVPKPHRQTRLSSRCPGKIIQFFIDISVGLAGSHFAADCRVHLHLGAGEDSAPSTEQPAETLHPGLRGFLLLMCHSFHKPL